MGLEQVRVAVVTMGTNIEANILTSAVLKQMGIPRVVARANTSLHEGILKAVGVDRVINVHLPSDLDNYMPRVGRTARAGRPGLVVNLVTQRDLPLIAKLRKRDEGRG